MKVTAFVGTPQKRNTYRYTQLLLEKLETLGNVESELVVLNDYQLGICRGCRLCLDKGEELCPIKDDRDKLLQKMRESDGVIFASPNFSFQVSGMMKVFLDRLGYIFHRPSFFGKTFTSVVTQGIYGGSKLVKYFNFIAFGLGFNTVKGSCLMTILPITEESERINHRIIERQSRKFHARLMASQYPSPNLVKLMLFRMARSSMNIMLDESSRDFNFYKGNGWFESDYYYPVKLSLLKKWAGNFFDMRAAHVARARGKVGIF